MVSERSLIKTKNGCLDRVDKIESGWNFVEDDATLVAILELSFREGIFGLDVDGLGIW